MSTLALLLQTHDSSTFNFQQLEDLSNEFVHELHRIPPYDVGQKQKLASEYLNRVQSILEANIAKLQEDQAESVSAAMLAERVADRLLI